MYSSLTTRDIEYAYIVCFGREGLSSFLNGLNGMVKGRRKWYIEKELVDKFNQKNANLNIRDSNQLMEFALRCKHYEWMIAKKLEKESLN